MKVVLQRTGVTGGLALLGLVVLAAAGPGSGPAPSSGAIAYAAAKAPARKTAPVKPADTPSEADKRALLKVVEEIKQKIASSSNKQKAARDGLAALQQFAREHDRKPIGDSARLTAAQLQFDLGDTEPALAMVRKVANEPIDRQAGRAAQILLADMLARNGQFDEAEKVLNAVIARNEEAALTEAARGLLAAISLRPGRKALAFTAKDTAGQSHSLAGYEGKVLLIDFWATWCPPCREEIPNVKKVYARYKDQGFVVLAISLDRNQSELDEYVKKNEIAWPQIFEGGQALAEMYGVSAIPRTLLLDRQGVIRHVDLRGEELEKAVAELIGGEAPPP